MRKPKRAAVRWVAGVALILLGAFFLIACVLLLPIAYLLFQFGAILVVLAFPALSVLCVPVACGCCLVFGLGIAIGLLIIFVGIVFVARGGAGILSGIRESA